MMPLSDLFEPDTDLKPAPFCDLSYSRCILSSMDIGTDGRCILEDTDDSPHPRQLIAYRGK
jgi:hypothetical protein